MSSPRARSVFRRRAIVLVALIALVWCQAVAAAHACAASKSASSGGETSAQIASMSDCTGSGGDIQAEAQQCPASDATPDWHKLPAFYALPSAGAFAAIASHERGFLQLKRHELPQDRAPPRPQLCCWLI